MVYIDTLWCARNFYPYLQQRSSGTSLKLEDVARFRGIDFAKSLTHEELRDVELRRLAGQTSLIKERAMHELTRYCAEDLEATEKLVGSINPIHLILTLKKVLPFRTLTEIAFSTNCMNSLHEHIHFQRYGNLPYHGYKQKERENELQIFKKRFRKLKSDMLAWTFNRAGINKLGKGEYADVHEFYLPFEEWVMPLALSIFPGLNKSWLELGKNEEENFAFLQYLRAFLNSPLTDYYFARREEKAFNHALNSLKITEQDSAIFFSQLERKARKETLDSLIGSFRFLKNHFRSIYVPLNGNGRKLILPSKKHLAQIRFPEAMREDADLHLLKERNEEIAGMLSPKNQKILKSFLKNFQTFEEICSSLEDEVFSVNSSLSPVEFLYAYIENKREQNFRKRFCMKYGVSIDDAREIVVDAYKRFAENFAKKRAKFLEAKGDYIFVASEDGKITNIPGAYFIRRFEKYAVE